MNKIICLGPHTNGAKIGNIIRLLSIYHSPIEQRSGIVDYHLNRDKFIEKYLDRVGICSISKILQMSLSTPIENIANILVGNTIDWKLDENLNKSYYAVGKTGIELINHIKHSYNETTWIKLLLQDYEEIKQHYPNCDLIIDDWVDTDSEFVYIKERYKNVICMNPDSDLELTELLDLLEDIMYDEGLFN